MKSIATTFALATAFFSASAQDISSDNLLIRHDTMVLKASECNWVIRSVQTNGQESRSVPILILQAVGQHKLRAVDPFTGDPIAADKILTWRMPADTMAILDDAGNRKYKVVQAEQNPDHFTEIRVYQDWYFDGKNGKIRGEIPFFELLRDVYSPSGSFIGQTIFCRIYY